MYDSKTNCIINKNKKELINTLVLQNKFILVGDPPIDSLARFNLDILLTCYLKACIPVWQLKIKWSNSMKKPITSFSVYSFKLNMKEELKYVEVQK